METEQRDIIIKNKFCVVLGEYINKEFVNIAKQFCRETKEKTYITSFETATELVGVYPYDIPGLNVDELEKRWYKREMVEIYDPNEKKKYKLPMRGDFLKEYESVECEKDIYKILDSTIQRVVLLSELSDAVCTDRTRSLSYEDRAILSRIK